MFPRDRFHVADPRIKIAECRFEDVYQIHRTFGDLYSVMGGGERNRKPSIRIIRGLYSDSVCFSTSLQEWRRDRDTDEYHFLLFRPSQEFSTPFDGDRKFAGMISTRWKLQRVSRILRYRCQDEINFLVLTFLYNTFKLLSIRNCLILLQDWLKYLHCGCLETKRHDHEKFLTYFTDKAHHLDWSENSLIHLIKVHTYYSPFIAFHKSHKIRLE